MSSSRRSVARAPAVPVLYASATQGAVHGMQTTLSMLKQKGVLDARAVTSFTERQRLVDKQAFDFMEARYAAHTANGNGPSRS
jgi:hypothetical protein